MRIPRLLLLLLYSITALSQVPSAPELRIGAGDLLSVKVFNAPELTQDARVSASGEIVLPLLGPVRVLGMTPRQTELLLEQQLKDGHYLNNPHVTVAIAEYASQGISVLAKCRSLASMHCLEQDACTMSSPSPVALRHEQADL